MTTTALIRVNNHDNSKENWDFFNKLYDPYVDPQQKTHNHSKFAQLCFDAVAPFINTKDAGIKVGDTPVHNITKLDWEINAKYWAEKERTGKGFAKYPSIINGEKDHWKCDKIFHYWKDIKSKIYSPLHVERNIRHGETSYLTSGKIGLGMAYLDLDCHKFWQKDEYKALELIQDLIPDAFYRCSGRGQNGYLKIRYPYTHYSKNVDKEFAYNDYNSTLLHLQSCIRNYLLSKGILTDFEVKGSITTHKKSGSLAKLPFTVNQNPRDERDSWNYDMLQEFTASSIHSIAQVNRLCEHIESITVDLEKMEATKQLKLKYLDEDQKRKDDIKNNLLNKVHEIKDEHQKFIHEKLPALIERRIPKEKIQKWMESIADESWRRVKLNMSNDYTSHEYVCLKISECPLVKIPDLDNFTQKSSPSVNHDTEEAKSTSQPANIDNPVKITDKPERNNNKTKIRTNLSSDIVNEIPDAFKRTDFIVKKLNQQNRRVLSSDEVEQIIHDKGLYTAPWHNPKRRKRIEDAVRFSALTFDASKCGNGNIKYHFGRHKALAKKHFPNGARDLGSFTLNTKGEIVSSRMTKYDDVLLWKEMQFGMDLISSLIEADTNGDGSISRNGIEIEWNRN